MFAPLKCLMNIRADACTFTIVALQKCKANRGEAEKNRWGL